MAVGIDNQIIGSGVYSENDIQTRLHKYAQDEKAFQFLALYEKESISVLRVLSEKFGVVPAVNVTDFEYRYPEMEEIPYEYTPGTTSTEVGIYSNVSIADDYASSLYPSIILSIVGSLNTSTMVYADGLYVNADNTVTTVARGATAWLPEEVMVIEVGLTGSGHTTGYTNVRIQRCYPTDAPAPSGGIRPITTSHRLVLSNQVSREDGAMNPPITKNTDSEYNYVQTSRQSYGVSEHINAGIKTFLEKKPLALAYELCQSRMAKMLEMAILTGRRSKKIVNGKMLYQTGGILPFIPSTNIISLGAALTQQRVEWMLHDIGDRVGSSVSEMYVFGGTEFMTSLNNVFANKSWFTKAESESIKYRLNVVEWVNPTRNMTFKFVAAPILNVLGMRQDAVVLNLTDKYKCFQIAEKIGLEDRPKDKASASPDGVYSTLRELYTMWGLVRRRADTHFWITGVQISH